MSAHRTEFIAGARAEAPILFGVAPFGLIYGVLAAGAGLPPAQALAMSSIVFAGSAQFIAAGQIGAGVPSPVLVLTTFVVNLRHMLYSASLAPYLRRLSPAWKAMLAYLLTDEAYVIAALNYERPTHPALKHWYFLGAGLALWTTRQISSSSGIFLGAQVPPLISRALSFVPPAVLSAIILPELLQPGGKLNLSVGNARLLAGVFAMVVAWRTRNVLLTVGAGMVGLWVLQSVLG